MIWYFGDSAGINFNSGQAVSLGNGFSYSLEANSNICDKQGNLLFCAGFTMNNDFYVWNSQHNVMLNSGSITGMNSSQTFTQGLLILPFPGDSTLYYLFTQWYNYNSFPYHDLKYHIIDMKGDSGRGEVIASNINVCSTCSLTEKMIGIRHANGRDWWLLGAEWPNTSLGTTGHFVRWLITPFGVSSKDTQNIVSGFEGVGQMAISPIGDKIVTADDTRQLHLYDFDRCTGILSNWLDLGYPINLFAGNGFYGCSFSPSGRYLYASRLDSVFQFDITASNIYASKVFLGKEGHVGQYNLGQHKLGPDGKIYFPSCNCQGGGTLGWEKFLNVINYPDSAGTACGLVFHSFGLGDRSALWGMPNIPDFNLGAIPGSPCDSLMGMHEVSDINCIRAYPNPASASITLRFKQAITPGNTSLEVTDITGRTLESRFLPPGQQTYSIDVSGYAPGLYFIRTGSKTLKFIKQ